MNLRALTRGDAAVAGAAVLLFISSFLPYVSYDVCLGLGSSCASQSENAWTSALLPLLPSVFLLGIIGAALILVQRFQGEAATSRQVLGLRLDQWGIALSVAALWSSLWSLGGGGAAASHSFGAWLALLSLLVLAGAAAAGPLVPALQAPLLTDKPAAAPQGYTGYQVPGPLGGPGGTQAGGQQPQPGQYGYPGAQGGVPQAGAQPGQPYGAQQQPAGYGYPAPGQPQDQVPATVPAPAVNPVQAAPAADFAPFWFAVPAPRQLSPKDNPVGAPIGELVPGTWYLAVEQRGAALVAQLTDGSHGLLTDTSGIQRG